MIVHRFRAMGWALGAMSAATGLYLISLQVAAERGRLETVERRIAQTRHQLLVLQTEFGTRASMRQLEKYNGNVLALSTPKAVQFLQGEVQLASLDAAILDGKPGQAPKVMMVSANASPAPAPATPAPAAPAPLKQPKVRYATFTKPATPPRAEKASTAPAPAPASTLLRQASLTVGTKPASRPGKLAQPMDVAKPHPKPERKLVRAAEEAKAGLGAMKPKAPEHSVKAATKAKAATPATPKPLLKAGTLAGIKSAAAKEGRKR